MKKTLLVILLLALMIIIVPSVVCADSEIASGSCGTSESYVKWKLYDTGVLAISGSGDMNNYSISIKPAPWQDYYSSITSVTIGEGVTSVGSFAFYNNSMSNITSISLPSTLTTICGSAFYNCDKITSITLPAKLTKVYSNAFNGCAGLKTVYYTGYWNGMNAMDINQDTNQPLLEAVWYSASARGTCGDHLTWAMSGDTLTISGTGPMYDYSTYTDTTDNRPPWWMYRASQYVSGSNTNVACTIRKVIIEDGVTGIGEYAFDNCILLTEVVFPESGITVIPTKAFSNCGFSRLSIPSGVTKIGESAFEQCTSLVTIKIPDSVQQIDSYAFNNCTKLTDIILPDGLTEITYCAFNNCRSLSSITIPSSVTTIANAAFNSCNTLSTCYYKGSETQWNSISIGSSNDKLIQAEKHYQSITGGWGSNLTWMLNGSYLHIMGKGDMADFSGPDSDVAWRQYLTAIENVQIDEGITNIGQYAFYNASSLQSAAIPDSVSHIGYATFAGCSSLTSITLPTGISTVPAFAFSSCVNLESVTFPATISSIEEGAFSGCSKLTDVYYNGLEEVWNTVTIASNNDALISAINLHCTGGDSDVAYSGSCGMNLTWKLYYNGTLIIDGSGEMMEYSSSSVPWLSKDVPVKAAIIKGGKTISNYAFYQCTSLKTLILPSSITKIGNYAFFSTSLTRLELPEGLKEIGSSAFQNSTLTEVILPNTLTTLGYGSFDNCKSLEGISIPGRITEIPVSCFSHCEKLTDLLIPASVKKIQSGAFDNCYSLISVSLPENLSLLGLSVFSSCYNLEMVTFPASMQSVPQGTFSGCKKLTHLDIPSGITSIGSSAFSMCSSLETIYIPASVTTISDNAFTNCSALTDVYYGGTETDWNNIQIDYSFGSNNALKSATIHYSHTHTLSAAVHENEIVATCSDPGKYDEVVYCSECGMELSREAKTVDPVDHNLTLVSAKAATCTDEGNIEYWICSFCRVCFIDQEDNHELSAEEIFTAPLGHVWSEPKYDWAEDNLSLTATHICGRDEEHVETETVICTTSVIQEPTCTEKGKTAYTPSAFENNAFTAQPKTLEDIPAIGHYWKAPEYVWSDDNLSVTATRICNHDSKHVETETVQTDYVIKQAAECESDGSGLYTTRAFSNNAFSIRTKEITIPSTGHTPVVDEAITPTECTSGLTEGSHCSACNKVLVEQEYIHPLLWRTDENEEGLTILEYYGTDRNVSIPITLDGVNVIGVANGAFVGDSCPDCAYFPDEITFADEAFDQPVTVYCTKLSEAYWRAKELDYDIVCQDDASTGVFYTINLPDDFRMKKNDSTGITWSIWPLTGQEEIVWENNHPEYVSFDTDTYIATANLPGTTEISITVGNVTESVNITVWCNAEGFTLSESEVYVESEYTKQITVASVEPVGADLEVTWQTSASGVASIDTDGLITAKRIGDATITATSQTGINEECIVHVCYPVESVELSATETTFTIDDELQLTATVATRNQQYINKLVTFTSSNPDVLTVDASGVIRAVAPGTASVTVASASGKSDNHDFIVRSATYQPLSVTLGVPYIESTYVQNYGTLNFIKFDATVTGGLEPYNYVYQMKRDGEVVYTSDMTSSNVFSSTRGYTSDAYMRAHGIYTATVTVTDAYGDNAFAMSDGYYEDGQGYSDIGICCSSCKSPYKTVDQAVAATCVEEGLTEGEHCTDCGAVIVAQDPVPKLGHDWDSPVYEWSQDYSSLTAYRTCKRDGSHVETKNASISKSVTQSPSMNERGEKRHTASFDDEDFETQQVTLEIPSLDEMSTMILPNQLTCIETEAFDGIAAEAIIVPDGCTNIAPKAFVNCKNLLYVRIPAGVEIPNDAFTGCPNVLIDQ